MAGRPQGSTGTAPAAGGDVVAPGRSEPEPDPSGDVGRLYRALVEHAREAVTIVDASGVVVYHNPSMGRVVGRPPEWFEGRSPLELMPPEDAARAVRVLRQLAGKPGAQLPGEFRLRAQRRLLARGSRASPPTCCTTRPCAGSCSTTATSPTSASTSRRCATSSGGGRSLLEEIINAESEQRSRIAGELHDDTIQVMIASLVELDRGDRHLRDGDVEAARDVPSRGPRDAGGGHGPHPPAHLRAAAAAARGGRSRVRRSATWPRAAPRHRGRGRAVRTRVGRYPVDLETLAYRTIREALINVRRHARARATWRSTSSERRGDAARDRPRRRAGLLQRTAAVAHVEEHRHRDRRREDPRARRQLRGDVEPRARAPPWSSRCRCRRTSDGAGSDMSSGALGARDAASARSTISSITPSGSRT